MKLHYIALTPSDTAAFNGALTIDVVLGGTLELTATEIVQLIDNTVSDRQLKTVVVTIDGVGINTPDPAEANEILSLVEVLRSRGAAIIGKTHGNDAPLWFHPTRPGEPRPFGVTYTVAAVTNEPWLNFTVNEIHYTPPLKGPLKEPPIYPDNRAAVKRLIINQSWQLPVVYEFIRAATHPWSIAPTPHYNYAVILVSEPRS